MAEPCLRREVMGSRTLQRHPGAARVRSARAGFGRDPGHLRTKARMVALIATHVAVELRGHSAADKPVSGYSSQVRPWSSLPAFFLLIPPHCLKKNAVPDLSQADWIWVTHFTSMGRAEGPDSPPTIAQ